MKKILLGILALVALAGCGGGGKDGKVAQAAPENINSIAVPPQPDATANAATVAGVDSDSNGVRDDIDRKLATDFGGNTAAYTTALNHAKTLQAALVAPGATQVAAHIAAVACADQAMLDGLKAMTLATLDTDARKSAYAEAFAGASISSAGCAK